MISHSHSIYGEGKAAAIDLFELPSTLRLLKVGDFSGLRSASPLGIEKQKELRGLMVVIRTIDSRRDSANRLAS